MSCRIERIDGKPVQVTLDKKIAIKDTSPKPISEVAVYITPATVRGFNLETSRLRDLTNEYNKVASEITKGELINSTRFVELQNEILESYQKEVQREVSKISGVEVEFNSPFLGAWDGNFEPPLNMVLKIAQDADTQSISKLLFDLAEATSQDAFILEENSEITDRTPLTEFSEDGMMHYPQLRINFPSELTVEEKSIAAQALRDNGIQEFSIDGDFLLINVIDFNSETNEQQEQNFTKIKETVAALFSGEGSPIRTILTGNVQENVRKSRYVGARNEGDKQSQTREYDRSDLFEERIVPTETDSVIAHKQRQLEIILEHNPMLNGEQLGVRELTDIKTLQEAVGEEVVTAPDFTEADLQRAVETGRVTVYSSKEIKQGTFVTPSRMEAESYAGGEQVYSKSVLIRDVAWLDTIEGQLAEVPQTPAETKSEIEQIIATAKVEGTYLLAPNGQPTNLSEEQWAQVRTQNFINWFGDWINDPQNASKVVDENGEPQIMYHGTEAVFNEFTKNRPRSSGDSFLYLGDGFYFTNDFDTAQSYSETGMGRVVEAFLNIRRPYLSENADHTLPAKQGSFAKDIGVEVGQETEYLSQKGHDGVISVDVEADYIEANVYEPNNIKSATDNIGTFDPDNLDIRYQEDNQLTIDESKNLPKYRVEIQDLSEPTDLVTELAKVDKIGEDKATSLARVINQAKNNIAKRLGLTREEYDRSNQVRTITNVGEIVSDFRESLVTQNGLSTTNNPLFDYFGAEQIKSTEMLYQRQVNQKYIKNLKLAENDYILSSVLDKEQSYGFLGYESKLSGLGNRANIVAEIERRLADILDRATNTNDFYIQKLNKTWLLQYQKNQTTQDGIHAVQQLIDGDPYATKAQIEHLQEEQRNELLGSLRYLIPSMDYSPEFKYLMVAAILRGNQVNPVLIREQLTEEQRAAGVEAKVIKEIPGDQVRRNNQTTGSHQELSSAVLPNVYQEMLAGTDLLPMQLLDKHADKSYISRNEAIEIMQPRIYKEVEEGTWIRFEKSSSETDIEALTKISKLVEKTGMDNPWCTGGGMATTYLPKGDFYLFMNKNMQPEITIRYDGENIEEIRGTEDGQRLSQKQAGLSEKFLDEIPNGPEHKSQVKITRHYYQLKEQGSLSSKQDVLDFIAVLGEEFRTYDWKAKQEYQNLRASYIAQSFEQDLKKYGLDYYEIITKNMLEEGRVITGESLVFGEVREKNLLQESGEYVIPAGTVLMDNVSLDGSNLGDKPLSLKVGDNTIFHRSVIIRDAILDENTTFGENVEIKGVLSIRSTVVDQGFNLPSGLRALEVNMRGVDFDGEYTIEGNKEYNYSLDISESIITDKLTVGDNSVFKNGFTLQNNEIGKPVVFGENIEVKGNLNITRHTNAATGFELGKGLKVGGGINIASNTSLGGDIIIGENTSVEGRVSIIGNNTKKEEGKISIKDNSQLGEVDFLNTHINNVEIGDNVKVRERLYVTPNDIGKISIGDNLTVSGELYIHGKKHTVGKNLNARMVNIQGDVDAQTLDFIKTARAEKLVFSDAVVYDGIDIPESLGIQTLYLLGGSVYGNLNIAFEKGVQGKITIDGTRTSNVYIKNGEIDSIDIVRESKISLLSILGNTNIGYLRIGSSNVKMLDVGSGNSVEFLSTDYGTKIQKFFTGNNSYIYNLAFLHKSPTDISLGERTKVENFIVRLFEGSYFAVAKDVVIGYAEITNERGQQGTYNPPTVNIHDNLWVESTMEVEGVIDRDNWYTRIGQNRHQFVNRDGSVVVIDDIRGVKPQVLEQTKRGAIIKTPTKTLTLLDKNNADVTTPIHELAHEYETVLTKDEIKTIEDWSGHKHGTTEFSEAFAKGAEKYIFEGTTFLGKVDEVFQKLKQWFKEVILDAITYFGDISDLNADMIMVYDKMFMDGTIQSYEVERRTTQKQADPALVEQQQIEELNLKTIKNKADEIIKGETVFKRLSQREQRGFTEIGEAGVEATILLDRIYGTSQQGVAQAAQEETIKEYAKKKGIWVEDVVKQKGEPHTEGAEALVWFDSDTNIVSKAVIPYLQSPQEYLDRLSIHNTLFPETAIQVVGFSQASDGTLQFIVEQPLVIFERGATREEVQELMSKLGFEHYEDNDYLNNETLIEDLHQGNVVIDKATGRLAVIDPIIRFNTPEGGFGGDRVVGTNRVEAVTADLQAGEVVYDIPIEATKEIIAKLERSGLAHSVTLLNSQELSDKLSSLSNDIEVVNIPNGAYVHRYGKRHVYLNSDVINPNTAIHEFAHPYLDALQQYRRDLFDEALNLLDSNSKEAQVYIDYVNQTQPQLEQGTELWKKEVLAQAIGDNGAQLLESTRQHTIKDWLSRFWEAIKNMLGLQQYSVEEVARMTIKEFSEAVVSEMTKGEVLFDIDANFRNWSKGYTLVENEGIEQITTGQPVVVRAYHGTTHDFDEFRGGELGSPQGHMGRTNYFTVDYSDALSNYLSDGGDLQSRITRRAEDIVETFDNEVYNVSEEEFIDFIKNWIINDEIFTQLFDENTDFSNREEIARIIAESELKGENDQIKEVYIKMDNPVVIGNRDTYIDNYGVTEEVFESTLAVIAEEEGMTSEEYIDEYGEDYAAMMVHEYEGANTLVVDALEKAMDDSDAILSEDAMTILDSFAFSADISVRQIEEHLRRRDIVSEEGEYVTGDIIKNFFHNLGYDGIILTDVANRFQGMGLSQDVAHIHVTDDFNNKIKNADGTNVTFDEKSRNYNFQFPNNGMWDTILNHKQLQKLNNEQIKEYAKKITDGEAFLQRLSPVEEQGRNRGGSKLVELSLYLEQSDDYARQTSGLATWARENGHWVELEKIRSNPAYEQVTEPTAESLVFIDRVRNTVIKVVNTEALDNSPMRDFIDQRIVIHNHLFFETAYSLVGITEPTKGGTRPSLILEQPFIEAAQPLTREAIKLYMEAIGFTHLGGNEYSTGQRYILTDISPSNVIQGKDGNIYIIDPSIILREAEHDTGGRGIGSTNRVTVPLNITQLNGADVSSFYEAMRLTREGLSEVEVYQATNWRNDGNGLWKRDIATVKADRLYPHDVTQLLSEEPILRPLNSIASDLTGVRDFLGDKNPLVRITLDKTASESGIVLNEVDGANNMIDITVQLPNTEVTVRGLTEMFATQEFEDILNRGLHTYLAKTGSVYPGFNNPSQILDYYTAKYNLQGMSISEKIAFLDPILDGNANEMIGTAFRTQDYQAFSTMKGLPSGKFTYTYTVENLSDYVKSKQQINEIEKYC